MGNKTCKRHPNLSMAGIDVNFLFTNIPQDENINICIDSFDNENENTPKIPKDIFRTLLNLATTALSFIFDKSFYKQIDGVAIGYPLSPTLCSFENKWLKDCPHDFKPVFYRPNVDGIFV